jgi:hypothetical protein
MAVSDWSGQDWALALGGVTVFVTGMGGFITSMVTLVRVGKMSTNVDRLEKNTNSISERNQAIAMKLGITEGIAQERASVQAGANGGPVPVVDDRTAAASERSAAANERLASAAKRKPRPRRRL